MGNLLFVAGFTLLSGVRQTLRFFGIGGEDWKNQWIKRWRGLVSFVGGMALTLSGYTFVGFVVIAMIFFLSLYFTKLN